MSSIIDKIITLDNKENPLILVPFSDIHLGSIGVNKVKFNNLINWIKNTENCFAVGLGDYCDCIVIKDKRFDIKTIDKDFIKDLDNLPMAQINYLKKTLDPIKNKILCMIPGNHENKFRIEHSIDIMSELQRNGYQIGDYMTFLRLKFNKLQFHTTPITIWLQHGWFSGRKMGSKVNQLIDISNSYESTLYIVGHSHDLFATTNETISISSKGKNLIKNKKIFINSGTFLETISLDGSNYSEQKAYPVAKIGTAYIYINPLKKPRPDIHVRI